MPWEQIIDQAVSRQGIIFNLVSFRCEKPSGREVKLG